MSRATLAYYHGYVPVNPPLAATSNISKRRWYLEKRPNNRTPVDVGMRHIFGIGPDTKHADNAVSGELHSASRQSFDDAVVVDA